MVLTVDFEAQEPVDLQQVYGWSSFVIGWDFDAVHGESIVKAQLEIKPMKLPCDEWMRNLYRGLHGPLNHRTDSLVVAELRL